MPYSRTIYCLYNNNAKLIFKLAYSVKGTNELPFDFCIAFLHHQTGSHIGRSSPFSSFSFLFPSIHPLLHLHQVQNNHPIPVKSKTFLRLFSKGEECWLRIPFPAPALPRGEPISTKKLKVLFQIANLKLIRLMLAFYTYNLLWEIWKLHYWAKWYR